MAIGTGTLDDDLIAMALRLAGRCGELLHDEIVKNASRRTGEMADSVEVTDPEYDGEQITMTASVGADYGIYQEEGTGIFGPLGTPITPKRPGGVLVFDWPAAGGVVFARKVRGSEPTRFWSKALAEWPQIVARVNAGG